MSEAVEGALSISKGRIWARRVTGYQAVQNVLWPIHGEAVDVTEAVAVILAPLITQWQENRERGG